MERPSVRSSLDVRQRSSFSTAPVFVQKNILKQYLPTLGKDSISCHEVCSDNNQVYLCVAYAYMTRRVAPDQLAMQQLRSAIDSMDFLVVQKQTVPRHLSHLYDNKSIRAAISTFLYRVQQARGGNVAELVKSMYNELSIVFSLVLLIRQLALRSYNTQKESIWMIGNQDKFIKDYNQDARGNILTLLSQSLSLDLDVHVCNNLTKTANQLSYKGTRDKANPANLFVVIDGNKTYMVKDSGEASIPDQLHKEAKARRDELPKKRKESYNIQEAKLIEASEIRLATSKSTQQTSLSSSSVQIKSKNCPKCGRVKTQKFCICRKSRDDSTPKQPVSKFQSGIVTSNCFKCLLNRPKPGQQYCQQCKTVMSSR